MCINIQSKCDLHLLEHPDSRTAWKRFCFYEFLSILDVKLKNEFKSYVCITVVMI